MIFFRILRIGTKENQGKLPSTDISDLWVMNWTEYFQIQVRDCVYIFLYCLFNDAGSSVRYKVSNDSMICVIMSWKGCSRWCHNLAYCRSVSLVWLNETVRRLTVIDFRVKIWNLDYRIPDRSPNRSTVTLRLDFISCAWSSYNNKRKQVTKWSCSCGQLIKHYAMKKYGGVGV
jgi:hypothetical protein